MNDKSIYPNAFLALEYRPELQDILKKAIDMNLEDAFYKTLEKNPKISASSIMQGLDEFLES